jgi:5-deoxy-glucuronate isomerase
MADNTQPSAAVITRHRGGFPRGLTWITQEGEAPLDTGTDFGILRMGRGERLSEPTAKETAWVLFSGQAEVEVGGLRAAVSRASLFDEAPTVVHVPAGTRAHIDVTSEEAEWGVVCATNPKTFEPRIFFPGDIQNELRGKGLVQEGALRVVRLAFDLNHRPESNLVLGEVINYPGRWSSYPPHHHAQTELYHYRFTLPQGYGHAELGDEVYKVRQYDTVKIQGGLDHPQVSAPGYGMYYLWIVRHQPGNPYRGFEFSEEHRWVLDGRQQGWRPPDAGER